MTCATPVAVKRRTSCLGMFGHDMSAKQKRKNTGMQYSTFFQINMILDIPCFFDIPLSSRSLLQSWLLQSPRPGQLKGDATNKENPRAAHRTLELHTEEDKLGVFWKTIFAYKQLGHVPCPATIFLLLNAEKFHMVSGFAVKLGGHDVSDCHQFISVLWLKRWPCQVQHSAGRCGHRVMGESLSRSIQSCYDPEGTAAIIRKSFDLFQEFLMCVCFLALLGR